jgi:hypothetical protein
MARLPHRAVTASRLVVLVAVLVTAVAVSAAWLRARRPAIGPAGAELLADSEGRVWASRPSEGPVGPYLALDDVRLSGARVVSASDDDFALYTQSFISPALLRATVTGDVRAADDFPWRGRRGALDMAPDGRYAATDRNEVLEVRADWRGDPDHYVEAQRAVGAVDVDMDGQVLVGGAAGPTIDSIAVDGTTRRLLAPAADPGAEVTADKGLGPIVALHRLPDQRVVFVSSTAAGFRLHVIDGGRVRVVEDDAGRNPVRFTGRPPVGWDGTAGGVYAEWPHLPVMTPLAPGPGGRVITIGLGRGDVPEISLVDVDTGEIVLLARLDGVEASDAQPVSAAAVGDDLVFTAAGCLWRLEGAFVGLTQG